MKPSMRVFLLLLAILLCTAACASPAEPVPGSDQSLLIGDWYSFEQASVLSFSEDGTVFSYQLYPGYYEYLSRSEYRFAYSNGTLTVTTASGESKDYTCTVADQKLTLERDNGTSTYLPAETLPAEHVLYSFPVFSELVREMDVSVPKVTGNTIETDLFLSIPAQMRSEYWENKDVPETIKTSGVIQKGDLVLLDYKGYVTADGGEKSYFDGGSANGQKIIAMDGLGYIDGFGSGLIGHEIGTTFPVDVVFPEQYGQESLAGQPAVFEMTVYGVFPDVPDDEVPGLTDSTHTTFAEWKAAEIELAIREQVIDLLPEVELPDSAIPEGAYNFFYHTYRDRFHKLAFNYGMDYEEYLALAQITDADILSACRDVAREYLRSFLIFSSLGVEIPEKYRLRYADELIQEYIGDGTTTTRHAVEAYLDENPGELESYVVQQFLSDYLYEQNTFVAPAD